MPSSPVGVAGWLPSPRSAQRGTSQILSQHPRGGVDRESPPRRAIVVTQVSVGKPFASVGEPGRVSINLQIRWNGDQN